MAMLHPRTLVTTLVFLSSIALEPTARAQSAAPPAPPPPAPATTPTSATPPATSPAPPAASAAPATTPETAAPGTAAATTTATTTTATTPPTVSAAPAEISEVDGWRVVSFKSAKRLPDGRPTEDACGWERDAVVEPINTAGDVRNAVISVPCKKEADGALAADAPTIRFAQPPPAAAAKPSDVQSTIAARKPDVLACQTRDPSAHGTLKVTWKIAPDGKTSDVRLQPVGMKSAAVEACVVSVVTGWTFPPHQTAAGVPAEASFDFAGKVATNAATKAATNAATNAGAGTAPLCKPDEKPKKKEELAEGELACVEPRPCAQGEKPLPPDQVPAGQQPCKDVGNDRGVPFLKGELTRFGDVQLVNSRSSFGVALGPAIINNVWYAQLRPDLNLRLGSFNLGLGAPLRFEIADFNEFSATQIDSYGGVFANAGQLRSEDWDQIEDFLRPLRYLTWGRKEDHLYIDVNRVHSVTLGHGQLIRRYTPNIDVDEDNLIAAVDGYGDLGGVELIAGPFPVPRVAGGLVFVKPLSLFSENDIARSWSVGMSWAADLNAPTSLDRQNNLADGRAQLVVDQSNQFVWRGKTNPVGDMVQGIGLDTEVKVLKLSFLDIKLYGDYSHLFFPADTSAEEAFESFSGGGAAVGALFRLSFGAKPVRDLDDESPEVQAGRAPREMKAAQALRLRFEGRTFSPQYLPSYFNTMYEVDRLQFGVAASEDRAALPTKIGFLATRANEPLRAGFYTEASWSWVDALGVTLVYEDAVAIGGEADPVLGRNFAAHVETDGLGFLQLFASYHCRNFEDFGTLFSFSSDNEILFAGGRLEILPILFINVAAQRAFRVGFAEDDLARQSDKDGFRYSSVGFTNQWTTNIDVELGWQFD